MTVKKNSASVLREASFEYFSAAQAKEREFMDRLFATWLMQDSFTKLTEGFTLLTSTGTMICM